MREQILAMIQNNPQLLQLLRQAMMEAQQEEPMDPEDIADAIAILEQMLQNPEEYQRLRMELLQEGLDAEDVPMEYDQGALVIILAVLYMMQEGEPPAYAQGGLNSIARQLGAKGRYGDTMVAHISPREARMLKRRGGSGTINPHTGLPEFFLKKLFKGVKKVVKKVAKALGPVLPIALSFLAPGLGTAIGGALGASGTVASVLGNAVLQGGIASAQGGDWKQAALFGGLTGGLSNVAGKAIAGNLGKFGQGLGTFGQNVLGGAAVGAVAGQLTGQGALRGMIQGGAGQAIGQKIAGLAGPGAGAAASGIRAGGTSLGNLLTVGTSAKDALKGGLTSGLAAAALAGVKGPSDLQKMDAARADVEQQIADAKKVLADPKATTFDVRQAEAKLQMLGQYGNDLTSVSEGIRGGAPSELVEPPPGFTPSAPTGIAGTNIGLNMPTALAALAITPVLQAASTPDQVMQAIQQQQLPADQQEYINRQLYSVDWNEVQKQAGQAGMGLGEYVATNWNKFPSWSTATPNFGAPTPSPLQAAAGQTYTAPTTQQASVYAQPAPIGMQPASQLMQNVYGQPAGYNPPMPAFAMGGGVLTRLAQGGGSGRDDTIMARLSDGEYVMDAETVAMLGDGSTEEGARRLDDMRKRVRSHKGKALAKGKFSPNARSPLAYLKGAL